MASKPPSHCKVGKLTLLTIEVGANKCTRLYNLFVTKILSFRFLQDPGTRDVNGKPNERARFKPEDDLDVCSYYLQTLSNVLKYSIESAMASIGKDKVANIDDSKARLLRNRKFSSNHSGPFYCADVL